MSIQRWYSLRRWGKPTLETFDAVKVTDTMLIAANGTRCNKVSSYVHWYPTAAEAIETCRRHLISARDNTVRDLAEFEAAFPAGPPGQGRGPARPIPPRAFADDIAIERDARDIAEGDPAFETPEDCFDVNGLPRGEGGRP